MNWFQRLTRKVMLRRLIAKPEPESYSTSLPEGQQKGYDYISVYGSTTLHADVLLRSWGAYGDIIEYIWWDEGAQMVPGANATCSFDELDWMSLKVRHRYVTWDIHYNSLAEAYWNDLFHLQILKWLLQKIRNRFLTPVQPDFRMRLLQKIVEFHSQQKAITVNELLFDIHGPAIRRSSDGYRHYQDLQFLLKSLQGSGDVLLKDQVNSVQFIGSGDVLPTPKAIKTLADFYEGRRRHLDTVKLTRRQLFVGWAMFAIAAATLVVEFLKRVG